jgi:hypothetical protein
MKIHWRNLAVLILGLALLFVFVRCGRSLAAITSSIESIGSQHGTPDRVTGMLALGFVGLTLIAMVKLLVQNRPTDRRNQRHDEPGDRED